MKDEKKEDIQFKNHILVENMKISYFMNHKVIESSKLKFSSFLMIKTLFFNITNKYLNVFRYIN